MRNLAKTYGIPDPLSLLQETPMPKTSFKKLVQDKIVAHWEKEMKERANMKYFNVEQLKVKWSTPSGHRWRHHHHNGKRVEASSENVAERLLYLSAQIDKFK